MSDRTVLFVFAHQDDEFAVFSRIAREVRQGSRAVCAYLTDGGLTGESARRDAETRAVLTSIGVAPRDILFLGSSARIADGRLVSCLQFALEELERATQEIHPDEIVTLAWEGGHQDHDAAHLVALALGARRSVPVIECPLYHGRGLPGPFFRVMSPLRAPAHVTHLTTAETIRHLLSCRAYASQRMTWIGLFPEAAVKLVFVRRETAAAADAARVRSRPHVGRLLYERRFGFSYEDFRRAAAGFIERHLGGGFEDR